MNKDRNDLHLLYQDLLDKIQKYAIETPIMPAEHSSIELYGNDTLMLVIREVHSTDTISANSDVKESYSCLHSALKNT